MRFYIIDAFTESVFGGNPAGVVILSEGAGFPGEGVMLQTAAELRYSETAFIRRIGSDAFHIRYFTPVEEVDLCGHATIASYFALLEEGLVKTGESYRTETLAGNIQVSVEKGFVVMDMAPPDAIRVIDGKEEMEKLYGVMGLSAPERGIELDREWTLYPEIISTGLPDILLPVADRHVLNSMEPDLEAMATLSGQYGVVGVHAFALGEALLGWGCNGPKISGSATAEVTAYCRNFAPAVGIDEEAATGTSNGALTHYLYKNGLIKGGMDCIYLQGEAMDRPSQIIGRLSPDGHKIRIGGAGAVLARGEITI